MVNGGKYFLPILNGLDTNDSEQKVKSRIGNSMTFMTPKLKLWFAEVNSKVFEMNALEDKTIPKIDEACTYYSARHSFAMSFMLSGGSPLALASLLGRSVNTLAQYVKELTEEADLVDAVKALEV